MHFTLDRPHSASSADGLMTKRAQNWHRAGLASPGVCARRARPAALPAGQSTRTSSSAKASASTRSPSRCRVCCCLKLLRWPRLPLFVRAELTAVPVQDCVGASKTQQALCLFLATRPSRAFRPGAEEYAESNMRFAQSADGGDGSIWRDVLLPQLSAGIDALVPLIAACDVAVRGPCRTTAQSVSSPASCAATLHVPPSRSPRMRRTLLLPLAAPPR